MTSENNDATLPAGTQGAIDLSAMKTTAAEQAPQEAQQGGSWVTELTLDNFQQLIQQSGRTPVLMSLVDPEDPQTESINRVVAEAVNARQGRVLLAIGDVRANPQMLQAFGLQQGPAVIGLLNAQPVPLLDRPMPREHVDQLIEEVLKVAAQQGISGTIPPVSDDDAEELSPEHQAAQKALESGDYDAALAAYRAALNEKPDDELAQQGISQVSLLKRVGEMDTASVREKAAAEQDNMQAQLDVADLDVVGGHVEDAFKRLTTFISTHFGEDRETARAHLVELYNVVGVHDPRVNTSRQKLARILF